MSYADCIEFPGKKKALIRTVRIASLLGGRFLLNQDTLLDSFQISIRVHE